VAADTWQLVEATLTTTEIVERINKLAEVAAR